MLTISQLASYAGVTVRAVRHYHAKGLLPEPERDTSGYRRYAVASVVELIRIRTLAEAGVPLVRVRELLRADEEELANAVTEIDARLRAEIRARQQHRQRIAQLAAGDRLALPEESVAYLQRLRELGFPQRMVDLERDAWTVIAAHSPELLPMFMAAKQQQFDGPETLLLTRDLIATVTGSPTTLDSQPWRTGWSSSLSATSPTATRPKTTNCPPTSSICSTPSSSRWSRSPAGWSNCSKNAAGRAGRSSSRSDHLPKPHDQWRRVVVLASSGSTPAKAARTPTPSGERV